MTVTEQAPRRGKNDHYAISFRQQAVRLVESGLSQQAFRQPLGVGPMTLLTWLRQYGTAVYAQMRRKLFTSTQKHQIARELLNGCLTEEEALLKYGLCLTQVGGRLPGQRGPTTCCRAGAADTSASLAAQLRQAQWQIKALHTLIDQAEAAYHIDIRIKGGAKPSK